MFTKLLFIILSFNLINGWGIVDWGKDVYDDTTETVSDGWNSLSNAVSDAADDTTEFFTSLADTPLVAEIVDSIQKVVTLVIDDIEDVVQDFNVTTWKKLVNDAKYVIYNLPSTIQKYIAIGCNYLSQLADLELVPFPFDVVKEDDFYTVVDCVADSVFDLAKDWTQEVATTFTNIIGEHGDLSSVDFSPLLNTESVKDELNDTYTCLFNLARDIEQRHKDNDDINLWDEATDYFQFNNLTLTIEITFTACTISCGQAALGFAVSSTDIRLSRPFYTVSMGVDSSSVVGASIGAALGFYKNFSLVTGSSHRVSFGAGIDLPLLPDINFPDVNLEISADENIGGEFVGFSLESDIIDFQFGLDGAFSVGYALANTKWVYTTDDLKTLWNAVEDIVDDRVETVNAVLDAYDILTNDILGNGGFFLQTAENALANLYCPSGISDNNDDNTNIGNLSVLQLGAIEIYDVVFGNIEGDNDCNSSSGYNAVKDICQYTSTCQFTANIETLGKDLYCDVSDISLSLIYGCPDQLDVFNLGCYAINFIDVVNNKWYQDYVDDNGILDDGWQDRNNGLAKCAKIAKAKGYPGFASYNNGMCLMAENLFDDGVFNKYGASNESTMCPSDGLGSDISMNLYAFADGEIAYNDLGCVNKTQFETYDANLESSFVSLEGQHYLFQDSYIERKNAISKCSQVAAQKGYKGFALSDGGKCVFSNVFTDTTIKSIRDSTNGDNNTYSCGKGTDYAYQTFQFPYININNQGSNDSSLTGAEIALIVILPLICIGICVAAFFLYRHKKNGGNFNLKRKNRGIKKKITNYEPPLMK